MRGIEIFQKLSYREISPMRDRPMRGLPVFGIVKIGKIGKIVMRRSLINPVFGLMNFLIEHFFCIHK